VILKIRYFAIQISLLCLLFQTGCTTYLQPGCAIGEEHSINELLYFGTAKPNGVVSPEEWQEFLRTTVTPRFPNGFTSWSAQGQWQGNAGAIVRETTFILNLIHLDDNRSETAINAIVNEYKIRFEQEAVLRVKIPVCTDLVKS
jgi:hypothetical protein